MQFKISVVLAFALLNLSSAAYIPRQDGTPGAPGTPSGKAPGTQFVTGNCASDADCQSKCCAKGKGTNGTQKEGVCANEIPTKERGQTCGFAAGGLAAGAGAGAADNTGAANNAAAPAASTGAGNGQGAGAGVATGGAATDGTPGAPGTPSGKAPGTQFVTGNCASDADCQSKCCAKGKGTNGSQKEGVCANEIPTKERGQTCGFAAGGLAGGAAAGDAAASAAAPAASGAAGAGANNAAAGAGTNNAAANNAAAPAAPAAPAAGGTGKFITQACGADSECAEGCCSQQGKCAGVIIALQRDGGCGCGAAPNDNAARAKFPANQIPAITPKAPAAQCAPKGGAAGAGAGGAQGGAAN